MATNTYVALDLKTLSSTSSITFTSIPQGYTDLVLVLGSLTFSSGGNPQIQFNGDTTTNYSNTDLYGNGSSAGSTRNSNNNYINVGFSATNGSATEPSTVVVQVMNYSNATTYKTLLGRGNRAGGETQANVGLWRATPAAITSMTVKVASGSMTGTAALYGIAAVPAWAAKATGGTIYYDIASGYVYHKFTSSGTFTPTQSLTADILTIAGGGAGGSTYGQAGGGGAGGLLYSATQSLTATGYSITVGGAGSTNSTPNGPNGTNGANSTFGSIATAIGGGGGGSYRNNGTTPLTGSSGGSGGGAGGSSSGAAGPYPGGAGTSGQGNTGGSGFGTSTWGGGGGGGAGAAGSNATGGGGYLGGNGGVGSSTYSAWGAITGSGQNVSGTYYYDGGGGGNDSSVSGYGNGAANTGGGGYGQNNGQSGIVIVRYLA